MGRERKDFKRKSGVRDARLYVIATEGEITEPKYFEYLKTSSSFSNERIHIEVIPSKDGKSAPMYVLEAINDFKKEYRIREDDELWIVIDRDFNSWSVRQLAECQTLCRQKKVSFGLSNPCFEIWILLHIIDVNTLNNNQINAIKRNAKQGSRTYIERKIIELHGNYNKTNPDFDLFIGSTQDAIDRSKALTNNDSVDLFTEIGTNIHVLIEKLTNVR